MHPDTIVLIVLLSAHFAGLAAVIGFNRRDGLVWTLLDSRTTTTTDGE